MLGREVRAAPVKAVVKAGEFILESKLITASEVVREVSETV